MHFLLTFMGLVCAACTPVHVPSDQANTVQIDVTDRYGNRVQLQKPAQRIVCLFEASVDDLYMLGAGSALVGIPAKIYSAPDLYRAYSILDRRFAQNKLQRQVTGKPRPILKVWLHYNPIWSWSMLVRPT